MTSARYSRSTSAGETSLPFFARKKTETDLASVVAARLAAIVGSSDDAIVSKTLDGTIMSWNSAAERIFGYSAAEMIGSSVYLLIPPELHSEERDILTRIAEGEHVAHFETTRLRRDGTRIAISLSISAIRDDSGSVIGISSIKRDITDHKQAEDALRQAARMEALGALASGIAHDFNNQLHALSGFAHFIAQDPGLGGAGRQDLMEIQKTIERMASLTRQLLAFARQQVLNPETLDLNASIDDTLPMLRRLIGSNLAINSSFAPGPKWVRVDRAQLGQVLLNLVINARDAMPSGGQLSIRTETLEVSPGQVLDGWEFPWSRAAMPSSASRTPARGSGRSICRTYSSRSTPPRKWGKEPVSGSQRSRGSSPRVGGRLQVMSRVGRGTTFRILLPLAAEPLPTHVPGSPAPVRTRSRARILVVDDEDAVRTVVTRMLQGEGYDVLSARHGEEALQHLEQVGGAVDVVITDVVMPVMGARELTEELARRYPDLSVVWMSGHPREVELRGADQFMHLPFLQKPIPPRVLSETIEQVFQRRRERP